jgi:antitoxin ParD1/3/4
MPTRNVNLTEHFDRFIEAGITSGRFNDASEVVREGLRLLEQREREDRAKLELLRAAAKEGFDQLDCARASSLNRWMTSMPMSTRSESKSPPR